MGVLQVVAAGGAAGVADDAGLPRPFMLFCVERKSRLKLDLVQGSYLVRVRLASRLSVSSVDSVQLKQDVIADGVSAEAKPAGELFC